MIYRADVQWPSKRELEEERYDNSKLFNDEEYDRQQLWLQSSYAII